eukprot:scaffold293900_cov27-Prasinocladus_malaysianus.AAC.1
MPADKTILGTRSQRWRGNASGHTRTQSLHTLRGCVAVGSNATVTMELMWKSPDEAKLPRTLRRQHGAMVTP